MIRRAAYISIHTSPLEQPGSGDAGGMNVYIHELAQTMAGRGITVEVFTRRTSPDLPETVEVAPGYTVVHIDAGPPAPVPVADLPDLVAEFAEGIVKWAYYVPYNVVHTHYWLSAWAGLLVKEALAIPLANSFHTLGRVKDATRHPDESPAGLLRIAAERDVIARSDCVIASTQAEFDDLVEHYDADPGRLCVSPPGIDHRVFRPGDRAAARAELGIPAGVPLLAFVGRIQPLKGLGTAVEALAGVRKSVPDARLLAVGGPSGPQGAAELARVEALIARLGLVDHVELRPPVAHQRLPAVYRAADVVLVPSRSESFGLVAAEAQACGVPVVATRVGGLAFAVAHGESGVLVDGWDPVDYAGAALAILTDPDLAARLGAGAVEFAETFSWQATADRLLELYRGISGL